MNRWMLHEYMIFFLLWSESRKCQKNKEETRKKEAKEARTESGRQINSKSIQKSELLLEDGSNFLVHERISVIKAATNSLLILR